MKMVELVCNIPNELYKKWEASRFTLAEADEFVDCVMNGTPLPKHHGRLIDADKLKKQAVFMDTARLIDNAPTVLEATKEGDGE